jgi:uncharacterized membrane protein
MNTSAIPSATQSTSVSRNVGLDAARGLIVALMALDHVRVFFSEAIFDPVDLTQTTPGYFATRWITHLCAPGFFFIAGLSSSLLEARVGKRALSVFLLQRGLWLMALEILLFGLAWSFNPGWWWFGVIWGLGLAMFTMAGLIHAPRAVLFTAALLFTLLHNTFWSTWTNLSPSVDALLYSGGTISAPVIGARLVLYPLLPWLCLMALGYSGGRWLVNEKSLQPRRTLIAGSLAVIGFVITRTLGYGQPSLSADGVPPGASQALTFFNVEKYPPSLQFSLVTVGVLLLLLWAAQRWQLGQGRWLSPLVVFGRVPFFFYLLHLYLIHAAAWAVATLLQWPTAYLFWQGSEPNLTPTAGYGFGLPGIYVTWLLILAVLLPACMQFACLKARYDYWWLKFL